MRHRFHYKSLVIVTIVLMIVVLGVVAMPRGVVAPYPKVIQPQQPIDEIPSVPKEEDAQPDTIGFIETVQLSAQIGKGASIGGIVVVPKKIIEDSRCPMNARCIQAGFARVQVSLIAGSDTQTLTMTLGDEIPATIAGKKIRLVAVSPENTAGKPTKAAEYLFTFEIQG